MPSARWQPPTTIAAGDARPFAGVPIAIKNNRAGGGSASDLRVLADVRASCAEYDHNVTRAPEGRRLRDRGHHHAARVRHPADERGAPVRSHAQPLGPRTHARRLLRRRRRGGRRGHRARRPRQRRRRLDPHPGGLLRARRAEAEPRTHLGRRPSSATPRLASTACSRAPSPTRPRSSTCSPATSRATPPGRRRRPSRSRGSAARDPGHAAHRRHHAATRGRRGRGPDVRPRRHRGRRAAALARARGRGGRSAVAGRRGCASCSAPSSPTRSRCRSPTPASSPAASRRAEDMEPMSWAIFSMVEEAGRDRRARRKRPPAGVTRAGSSPSSSPTTRCSRPRSPSARCRWARSTRPRPTRCRRSRARACSRRSRPSSTPAGQPGISLPLFEGDDGLPLGVQLVGRPAGEGALLALAAQLEEASPWAERRPPIALGVAD